MNIIITANSPGELFGWALPLTLRLKEEAGTIVILVLLPCVFSSGREFDIASKMESIDYVISSSDYFKFMFLGKSLKTFSNNHPDIIVHLGGDLFHSALMVRKFRIPAIAYKWANKLWDSYFNKYLVPDENYKNIMLNQGIKEEKIEIIGQFVADGVIREKKESDLSIDSLSHPVICFMPGSRSHEIRTMTPFYMKIAELILSVLPEASFILSISPFISPDFLFSVFSSPPPRGMIGSRAGLIVENEKNYLITSEGAKILLFPNSGIKAMNISDFVLTIPGTKCLEAAFLGKPMLVITPLNRADLIPYCGFIGLLDLIPIVGSLIKGKILIKLARNFGFTALPNIIARKQIVPEMTDILTPHMVSSYILEMLNDKNSLHIMSEELKRLFSPVGGASHRTVMVIKEIYDKRN